MQLQHQFKVCSSSPNGSTCIKIVARRSHISHTITGLKVPGLTIFAGLNRDLTAAIGLRIAMKNIHILPNLKPILLDAVNQHFAVNLRALVRKTFMTITVSLRFFGCGTGAGC